MSDRPENKLATNIPHCPLCGADNAKYDEAAATSPAETPRLNGPVRVSEVPVKTQKADNRLPPPELTRAGPVVQTDYLDDSLIGGKFTVFVLCYGDYPQLAETCIGSILRTFPRHRIDLRIIGNQVSEKTTEYLQSIGADKLYLFPDNRKKYVAMREVFRDASAPITTNYLLWFDDDTKIVATDLPQQLARTIHANHVAGGRLYGTRMYHDLRAFGSHGREARKWFEAADWWTGKGLRQFGREQHSVENGTCIDFVVGYFWAMATQMIRDADIPDKRLNHNGGDITIGAQIRQAGYKLVSFNTGKSLVWCPDKQNGGRRGYFERFPWP